MVLISRRVKAPYGPVYEHLRELIKVVRFAVEGCGNEYKQAVF